MYMIIALISEKGHLYGLFCELSVFNNGLLAVVYQSQV